MNEIKRKKYESPLTALSLVEVEDGICAASSNIQNPNTDAGKIEEHKTNTDFSGDFSSGWDTDPTNPSGN
ncbi:MAG: hypothetical protein ACI4A8_09055 [Muribaculaceae bacterium]